MLWLAKEKVNREGVHFMAESNIHKKKQKSNEVICIADFDLNLYETYHLRDGIHKVFDVQQRLIIFFVCGLLVNNSW